MNENPEYAVVEGQPAIPSNGPIPVTPDGSGKTTKRPPRRVVIAGAVVILAIIGAVALIVGNTHSHHKAQDRNSALACAAYLPASTLKTTASNMVSREHPAEYAQEMMVRQQLLLGSLDRETIAHSREDVRESMTDWLTKAYTVLAYTASGHRDQADIAGMNDAAKKVNRACGFTEDGRVTPPSK